MSKEEAEKTSRKPQSGHPGSPGEGLVSHTLQCPGWDSDTGHS